MPYSKKITSDDYYEKVPSLMHQTGDIWSSLPFHKLIHCSTPGALVITPACDLSNRKVETITYVPVIPVTFFFQTLGFLPDVAREILGQLDQLNARDVIDIPSEYVPPDASSIERARLALKDHHKNKKKSDKDQQATTRVLKGLNVLEAMLGQGSNISVVNDVKTLFGEKKYRDIVQRIIKNSFKVDLYFLPSDGQPPEWSGVPEHSVALFRYPLTCPTAILDVSQDINKPDWEAEARSLQMRIPSTDMFSTTRPLKRITLRPRFVADLITRYVGVHVRIGAPDFADSTIEEFANELAKG